ncbi:unnamed protein product, partial [marine sediment metagenome]
GEAIGKMVDYCYARYTDDMRREREAEELVVQ